MIINTNTVSNHSSFLPRIPRPKAKTPRGEGQRISPVLSQCELREIVMQILG